MSVRSCLVIKGCEDERTEPKFKGSHLCCNCKFCSEEGFQNDSTFIKPYLVIHGLCSFYRSRKSFTSTEETFLQWGLLFFFSSLFSSCHFPSLCKIVSQSTIDFTELLCLCMSLRLEWVLSPDQTLCILSYHLLPQAKAWLLSFPLVRNSLNRDWMVQLGQLSSYPVSCRWTDWRSSHKLGRLPLWRVREGTEILTTVFKKEVDTTFQFT